MKSLLTLLFLFFSIYLSAQENLPKQTLRGIIMDETLETTIPNAKIIIDTYPERNVLSNESGEFHFFNIPVGRYTLRVFHNKYEPATIAEIQVTSSKETYLEILLRENFVEKEIEEIVINAEIKKDKILNKMALAGGRMFSTEEANRYAGGFDDPARLASAFAGVAGGVSSNGISIHGNAPHLLQWRLEGIEIPNPNHFADLSTVGGGTFFSISSFILGNSDFLTGAFPAEYNNAISGIFDMNLKKGNNRKYEHTAEIGVTGINLSSEGPVSKSTGSSYIANYRHSIIKGLNFQDLSFKLNFPTKKSGTFSFWGIGSIDKYKENAEENKEKWENNGDRFTSDLKQYMGALGITYKYNISEKSLLESFAGFTTSEYTTQQNVLGYDIQYSPYLDLKSSNNNISLSTSLTQKFSPKHSNKTGISILNLFYDMNYRVSPFETQPMKTISNGSGSTTLFSGYSNSYINLSDNIITSLGINTQLLTLNNYWTIEPRASIKWLPDNSHDLTFAYGLHSRMEKMDVYFTKTSKTRDNLVNKNLDFTKAHHFLISYHQKLSKNLSLRIEPYFQHLYNVPVIADSSYSVINRNLLYVEDALVNKGKGRNLGIDITIERYLDKGYYYMFTGSIFDSKYKGGNGKWYNTRFNRNYIFNVLGGKEWMVGRNKQNVLGVNVKLTLQGGLRYSPIDEQATLLHPDKEIQYDETRAFEKQQPSMFLTNFTIKYRINRPKVSHEFAIKSINTTRDNDFIGYQFNYKENTIKLIKNNISAMNISYKIDF
ncbi:carboxypeptidase-like regulatory domain-containing protein [Apibacter raozihei]|uniref:TonB-dependent receptor n=1 Tax=Apibacter raozihei TaxID=2500547 RepID=UPI000FE3B300|nr:carboxypeptidase-like regulatory domain-containing protein [Apibacter raozihei]